MKRFALILTSVFFVATLGFAKGAAETAPAPAAPEVAAPAVEGKITVAAAANLSAVGGALKAAFLAQYPKAELDIVFGSSGALTTQIENGAPFQVFMAADTGFPARVVSKGLAASEGKVYATGTLALLSPTPRDFSAGLAMLKDPSVERFAIANPETAPYGKASVQAMQSAGIWEDVKAKVVTAQNIAQAVQYSLTAAGLGFINKSALYTKDLAAYKDKKGVNWIDVDPSTHDPIAQAFVVLKAAAEDPVALAFADFLSSPEAKKVFTDFGYAVP